MLSSRRIVPWLPLVGLSLAALVGWWAFDLDSLSSAESVAEKVRSLRDRPFAPAYVLAAFFVGSLLFFPVTALVLGTTLAFEPVTGFAYALSGVVAASATTYWSGRWFGARAFEQAAGPRLSKLRDQLREKAFRASVVARLLPLGNFSVINMFAGSLHVPFGKFIAGSSLGALPGVLLFSWFSERMLAAMSSPDASHVAQAAALLTVLLGIGAWLKWGRKGARCEPAARDSLV